MSCTLTALLIVALPVAAEDPKLPGPKIDFPEVKGFTLGKPRLFPMKELGYSVPYDHDTPRIAVTVYVSNKGLDTIPTGAKSEAVRTELKQVAETIQALVKQGLYKAVTELGEEELVSLGKAKGAPVALRRMFEITQKEGQKTLSEAYVTGYKDHFVKFRVTYPAEDKEVAQKKVAELLEAVGATLK